MNKHLLSLFVLIGFTLLALFPAATKSTIEHVRRHIQQESNSPFCREYYHFL
jgi:uncharacterized membrane protein YesL